MGPSQICGCPFREPRVFEIAHGNQSIGLAEVIDGREASWGGPGAERDKLAQTWSCGWCLWFVILQVFQADVPGSKFQGGQRGRKLRRGAVILRIFRERECVANGLKLLVPYFKFLLNIMIVCVCSARVQLQSTALLSWCNNVLCALKVFPLPLWKAYSAIPSGFVLPLMHVSSLSFTASGSDIFDVVVEIVGLFRWRL